MLYLLNFIIICISFYYSLFDFIFIYYYTFSLIVCYYCLFSFTITSSMSPSLYSGLLVIGHQLVIGLYFYTIPILFIHSIRSILFSIFFSSDLVIWFITGITGYWFYCGRVQVIYLSYFRLTVASLP